MGSKELTVVAAVTLDTVKLYMLPKEVGNIIPLVSVETVAVLLGTMWYNKMLAALFLPLQMEEQI
jgi:hypothetical protein